LPKLWRLPIRKELSIEIDPGFAQAYTMLAQCYQLAGIPDITRRMEELLRQALELDPNLPEAYSVMGSLRWFRYRDVPAAEEAYKKAVELGPNDSDANRNLGMYFYRVGKLEAAVAQLHKAWDLDPLYGQAPLYLAYTYIKKGAFDQAIGVVHEMLKLDPNGHRAHRLRGQIYFDLSDYEKAEACLNKALEAPDRYFLAGRYLAHTYMIQGRLKEAETLVRDRDRKNYLGPLASWAGDYPKARTYLEESQQGSTGAFREPHDPFPRRLFWGHALWQMGDRSAAEKWLSKRLERDQQWLEDGDESYLSPLAIAYVHSVRGEKDEALRWLQQAIDRGWVQYGQAQRNPLFENLHDDPRFQQMMAEVKIRADAMLRRVEEIEREWEARQ
jgi:tetratricopeptide (TPR) repeat protein